MKKKLFEYLDKYFPNLYNNINVRFELGDQYENGTDERIDQVYERVITIFENLFYNDDLVYIYVKDWENISDKELDDKSTNYIYKLLNNKNYEELISIEAVENNTDNLKKEYNIRVYEEYVSKIPYKEILKGIANYEQGRVPSIPQSIYFINTKKDIIFNMYDDRGCIVFSNSTDKLEKIYIKYNSWIVDFWRESISDIFKTQ